MMMMSKTIEELEKDLHNARASLSYYRNKGKPKHKKKPTRSANKVQYGKNWNDTKRAMSVVIARLTATTEEEFKQVREQADALSVMEARELTKGYAEEVAAEVKARQEKRKARETAKAKEEEPEQLSLALSQELLTVEQKNHRDAVTKMIDEAWPDTPAPVKKVIPKSHTPNYGDSEETYTAVPVKTTTLRLAKEVVSTLTGFEGLSNEQIVGHILCRYLQYNKEKKL
jgi:hypothetical protein